MRSVAELRRRLPGDAAEDAEERRTRAEARAVCDLSRIQIGRREEPARKLDLPGLEIRGWPHPSLALQCARELRRRESATCRHLARPRRLLLREALRQI